MTNIHEIGITLQTSIGTAHEGLGILEAGKQTRDERVTEYNSILTALGEIGTRLARLRETANETKADAVEAGGKLHQAGQTLEGLGTDHENITDAVSQFHLADNEADGSEDYGSGKRDSMVSVLSKEQQELGNALATVDGLQVTLERGQRYAVSLGSFAMMAGEYVEDGTNSLHTYAAGSGIPLVTE